MLSGTRRAPNNLLGSRRQASMQRSRSRGDRSQVGVSPQDAQRNSTYYQQQSVYQQQQSSYHQQQSSVQRAGDIYRNSSSFQAGRISP